MEVSCTVYDQIGRTYAATRISDSRIAEQISRALGNAETVVNVGAGTGSYEPSDRRMLAVEPSGTMLAQRPSGSAPVVQAVAGALPFMDDSFDAAMSVLSTHHWTNLSKGIAEMRRVSRDRAVVFTYDVECIDDFWVCRYFPFIPQLDKSRFVSIGQIAEWLGGASVQPVPIPADCIDGMLAAFWRRPEAYLDAGVRAGISSFAVMPAALLDEGLKHLEEDLTSGAWFRRYGNLMQLDDLDCGYRLLIADVER